MPQSDLVAHEIYTLLKQMGLRNRAHGLDVALIPKKPPGRLGDSPIQHLPAELLVKIFRELAHELHYAECTTWIRIGQVCRTWRDLVLGTPTLWSHVTINSSSSRERIGPWLARSRGVQLSVEAVHYPLDRITRATIQVYNAVLRELQRIRELEIAIPRTIFHQVEWPAASAAPAMRSIKFTGADDLSLAAASNMRTDAFASFVRTFGERFPQLEGLVCHFYHFNFSQWSLPASLTYLCIHNERNSRTSFSHGHDVGEVLDVLARLPLLTALDLRRTLPPVSHARLSTVSLPLLAHLSLIDSALSCGQLLEHLLLPPDTQLHLDLHLDATCSQIANIAPSVISQVRALVSSFWEVQMAVTDGHRGHRGQKFLLSAWRDEKSKARPVPSYRDQPYNGDIRIALSLEDTIDPYVLNDLWAWDFPQLETVFANFPLADAVALNIDFVAGRYIDMPGVYEQMENVKTLSVRGQLYRPSGASFTKLLEERADGRLLFPALQTMTVEGINFAESWRTDEGQQETAQRLGALLEWRRMRGAGPNKVVLRMCDGLTRHDFSMFSRSTIVDWDGWVQKDKWAPRI